LAWRGVGRNIGVIGAGTVLGMREGRVRSPIPEVAGTRRKCVYKKNFATACLFFNLYLEGGRGYTL